MSWRPAGGRRHGPWWSIGWDEAWIRQAATDTVTLWTVGECLATDTELSETARRAGHGDLAGVAELGGCYLTVLQYTTQTVVVPDTAGVHRVYTADLGGRPAWSTSQSSLGARMQAGPDLESMAAGVVVRGLAVPVLYEGVTLVPPGSAVTIRLSGIEVRDVRAPLSYSGRDPMGQAARRLGQVLDRAVARRCAAGRPIGVDVSGGLDSSVLACLAKPAADELIAVTYADRHLAQAADARIARRLAEHLAIAHHVVAPDASLHFGGMTGPLPLVDTPALAYGTLEMKRAQFAPIVAAGAAVHLTGRGGDTLIVAAPPALPGMWRDGHRLEAVARAASWAGSNARARHRAVTGLVRQATAPRSARAHVAAALADGSPWSRPFAPLDVAPSVRWLTPAGRHAAAAAVARARPASPGSGADLLFMGAAVAAAAELAHAMHGLHVSAPYMDGPVVAAVLALPMHQRTRTGQYKPLLKAAVRASGKVPDFVLDRADKTSFNRSAHAGLRANLTDLAAIIDQSQLAAAGLLDTRPVIADLKAVAAGAPAGLAQLHGLLCSEVWLSAEQAAAAAWWQREAVA